MPSSITRIEDDTFKHCEKLNAVTIPNSVTSIGARAFLDCDSLIEITIPERVASIGESAFYCSLLTSITILNPECRLSYNTISNESSYYYGVIRGYEGSTAQVFAEEHGYTFESLGTYTPEPGSVTTSSASTTTTTPPAFNPRTTTTTTTTTTTATTTTTETTTTTVATAEVRIDKQAVNGNKVKGTPLTLTGVDESGNKIEFPANSVEIGEGAQLISGSGEALVWISGDEATTIHNLVDGTYTLHELSTPAGYKASPDLVFIIKGGKLISIDGAAVAEGLDLIVMFNAAIETTTASTTTITSTTTTTNTNKTTIIASGECGAEGDNLTWTLDENRTLTISGTGGMANKSFNDQRWNNNGEDIIQVVIEDSVTSIGDYAFYGCTNLKSITIPDSVTSIDDTVFAECSSLIEVTILNPDCIIAGSAFANASNNCVICGYDDSTAQVYAENSGYTFESLGEGPSNGTCGEGLTWVLDNTGTLTINGAGNMCNYGWADVSPFYQNPRIKRLVIENGVISIVSNAFMECTSLTEVIIPDSVVSIGASAFQNCSSLTQVMIPSSVIRIDISAFGICESLNSFTILNPDCSIYDAKLTISKDHSGFNGIIRGYDNSTAQAYAEKWSYTFESLGEAPATEPFPDMDGNSEITASDAQVILSAFAELLSDNPSGLTPEQEAAADVDGNGKITAIDVQYTLEYFLYNTVLGQPITWDEILHPNDE